jgi:hypothetical protein
MNYEVDGQQCLAAVGAAHSALVHVPTMALRGDQLLTPRAISSKNSTTFCLSTLSVSFREVEKVGLYKPYDENFDNRLPKYMDVVVVLFSLPLANSDYRDTDDPIKTLTSNVPLWVDRASDLDQGTSLSFARIAGRCQDGVVMGKDGQLDFIAMDPDDACGDRELRFLVDRAEPGDSGTLLFSFDNIDTPKTSWYFYWTFTKNPNFNHLLRHGIATSIPSFDQLTWLPVSKKKITRVALSTEGKGDLLTANVKTCQKGVLKVHLGPDSALFGIFVDAD